MKQLTPTRCEERPSLEKVSNFLDRSDVELPQSLIEFWLAMNPISTLESSFRLDSERCFDITFFPFGNEKSEVWTFQKAFENLHKEFFENKYVSFGSDAGGWQFVISVQRDDFGNVYFCRMDEALEDALTPLAVSFDEFIERLNVEHE